MTANLIAFEKEDAEFPSGEQFYRRTIYFNLAAAHEFLLIAKDQVEILYNRGSSLAVIHVESPEKCAQIRCWLEENEWV